MVSFAFSLHIRLTQTEEEGEYEVEQILDKEVKRGKPVYLVKWKGYPESDATWEPVNNLGNVKNLIQQYEASHQDSQKGSDKSSKAEKSSEAKTKKSKSSVLDSSKKIQKQPKGSKSATGSKKKDSTKKSDAKESKASKDKDDSDSKISKVGEFSTDEPSKISDHASLDKAKKVIRDVQEKTQINQLFFKIEWQDRATGVKPTSTYYNFSTLKKKCPNLLLDYVSTMQCSE